jgi:redox-sensitive bicupin YhaK (pirin superfamily)
MMLGLYDEAQTVNYSLNPVNKCLFLFVIEGRVTIDGKTAGRRDALGIWDTSSVNIEMEAATEFLLIETPVNQK